MKFDSRLARFVEDPDLLKSLYNDYTKGLSLKYLQDKYNVAYATIIKLINHAKSLYKE